MSTNNNQAIPSNGNPLDQAVSPSPNDTPVISLDGTQFVVSMNLNPEPEPEPVPQPVEPHQVVVTQGACLETRPATPVQTQVPEWHLQFFHAVVCGKLSELAELQRWRRRTYGQEIADEYLTDHTPPEVLDRIETEREKLPPGPDTPSSAGRTPGCPSSSAASNRPGPGDSADPPPSSPPPPSPAGKA